MNYLAAELTRYQIRIFYLTMRIGVLNSFIPIRCAIPEDSGFNVHISMHYVFEI